MTWLNWKKWPYWLRGGIIGAVVTLIFFAFYYSCGLNDTPGPGAGFYCGFIVLFSPLLPVAVLFDQFSNDRTPLAIFPIAEFLGWLGIGALLGTVSSWSKSRKKNKDN